MLSAELFLDAANFVLHGLLPIGACSESHTGGDAWHARGMQCFMALLHSREYLVPVAFDVRSVCVQVSLEPCCREDSLANRDFLGNRDSDADRNDAQICNDFHSPIVIAVVPIEVGLVLKAGWIAQCRSHGGRQA